MSTPFCLNLMITVLLISTCSPVFLTLQGKQSYNPNSSWIWMSVHFIMSSCKFLHTMWVNKLNPFIIFLHNFGRFLGSLLVMYITLTNRKGTVNTSDMKVNCFHPSCLQLNFANQQI